MFQDKLEQIFDMQSKLDVRIIENMERPPPSDIDEWISMYATAIMHEAVGWISMYVTAIMHEAKWWKKSQKFDEQSQKFDEQKAKEELIDIWHFVVAASIEMGMKPHDILQEYERSCKIGY